MAKRTCESVKRLQITFLKQEGYLEHGVWRRGVVIWSSRGQEVGRIQVTVDVLNQTIRLTYKYSDSWTDPIDIDDVLKLTSTPCHFGGKRYWFLCWCKRRVGVLYAGGKSFACRHCYRLTYESQQEYRSSIFAPIAKLWDEEEWLNEEFHKMRVKFWKGQPTKRYQRWLTRRRGYEENSRNVTQAFNTMFR